MLRYFKPFLAIILFRKGPQDVPYSPGLLAFLCAVGFFLKVASTSPPPPYSLTAVLTLFTFIWIALFFKVTLYWVHQKERFMQTYTAAMGALLLQLILAQVFLMLLPANAMLSINLVFMVWSLAVMSHITSYALEIRVRYAVLLIIAFEVTRLLLLWGIYQSW